MSSNNRANSDNRPRDDMDTDRRGKNMDTNRRDDVHDDPGRRREGVDNEAKTDDRGNWLSPLIALLGLWMIVMALVLDVTGAHFWSDVLVGALLVAVGGYNYSRQANDRLANSAIALIAVAAGLWLIAAPYVLGADTGLTESAYDLWFYNHIAVGLLAAGLGAYSAMRSRGHQQDTRRTKA